MKIGALEAIIGIAVIGLLAGWWQIPTLAAAAGITQQQIGEACAGLSVQPSAYATAYFIDPTTNNQKTQVPTTMIFAKPGTSVVYNATTGSATQATITSVPCGTPLAIVAGDGGGTTYYYNAAMFSAVDKVSVFADLEVQKSGAASIYLHNATSTGWGTSTMLNNASMTDPDTTVKVQVKVPTTAGARFGDLGWALCVKYNSLNFTKIYPQPSTSSVNIPHVKGTANLDTVACYEMPGMLVSAGADWEGTLYLDPASGNHLNATTIGLTVVDKTNMLFNGQLVQGYDTSVTNGQNTDAGIADVSTATAVTIVPVGI